MRKFTAIVLIELVLIGSGALADRMFPEVPTWVLGTAIAVLLACGLALFLWDMAGESKDKDKLRNILREELEAHDVQIVRLKEVARRLPQQALGAEHTYARLPDGTNIVTMADGSVQLALPVRLSVDISGGIEGSLSGSVTKAPAPDLDEPEDE